MLIAKAFFALFAGFLSMAALVAAATALLVKLAPDFVGERGNPRPAYVLFNTVFSFFAAMVGGYVTALIATDNPLTQTLFLALVVLLLAALSALQQRGKQPIWYQLLLITITPMGVLLGGYLRLKITGLL